jgi:(1->4)-alpha-D-glucan 1-alpha-D-glucosylmutase
VDYALRRSLLSEMKGLTPEQIMARMDDGLPKLWVVHQAMRVRREHPNCFGPEGAYVPIESPERIVSFRRAEDIVVMASRLNAGDPDWGDAAIELPAGLWRNALTDETWHGGRTRVADLLARFPAALLTRNLQNT